MMQKPVKIPAIMRVLVQLSLFIKPVIALQVFNFALFISAFIYSPPFPIFPAIFIGGNLLIYSFSNYANMAETLLKQCQPQNIPRGKFEKTINKLQEQSEKLNTLGFQELDSFLLKRSYKIIILILKHQTEKIYWSEIAFVNRLNCSELFTEFDSGLCLSTASVSSGHHPRPPQYYLQYFLQADNKTLLKHHLDALELFRALGHTPVDFYGSPREEFTRTERANNRYVMSFPGWAFKSTFWVLFKVGKNHGMSIRDQLELGYIRIPKHK